MRRCINDYKEWSKMQQVSQPVEKVRDEYDKYSHFCTICNTDRKVLDHCNKCCTRNPEHTKDYKDRQRKLYCTFCKKKGHNDKCCNKCLQMLRNKEKKKQQN